MKTEESALFTTKYHRPQNERFVLTSFGLAHASRPRVRQLRGRHLWCRAAFIARRKNAFPTTPVLSMTVESLYTFKKDKDPRQKLNSKSFSPKSQIRSNGAYAYTLYYKWAWAVVLHTSFSARRDHWGSVSSHWTLPHLGNLHVLSFRTHISSPLETLWFLGERTGSFYFLLSLCLSLSFPLYAEGTSLTSSLRYQD